MSSQGAPRIVWSDKANTVCSVNRVLVAEVRESDMPVLSFTLSCSGSTEEWKRNCLV